MTESEARDFLEYQCARAQYVKTLESGVEYWRAPKPLRLRLYIHKGSLLTVLGSSDRWRAPVVDSAHHGSETKQGRQGRQERRREEGRR